ncbi:MAG: hypothetical protein MHPSP_002038 [Paramarteilia canceri]
MSYNQQPPFNNQNNIGWNIPNQPNPQQPPFNPNLPYPPAQPMNMPMPGNQYQQPMNMQMPRMQQQPYMPNQPGMGYGPPQNSGMSPKASVLHEPLIIQAFGPEAINYHQKEIEALNIYDDSHTVFRNTVYKIRCLVIAAAKGINMSQVDSGNDEQFEPSFSIANERLSLDKNQFTAFFTYFLQIFNIQTTPMTTTIHNFFDNKADWIEQYKGKTISFIRTLIVSLRTIHLYSVFNRFADIQKNPNPNEVTMSYNDVIVALAPTLLS